jgi:hypothetical protein
LRGRPKLGTPTMLRDLGDGTAKPRRYRSLNHVATRLRKSIEGDRCISLWMLAGMAELAEAELTDGRGGHFPRTSLRGP